MALAAAGGAGIFDAVPKRAMHEGVRAAAGAVGAAVTGIISRFDVTVFGGKPTLTLECEYTTINGPRFMTVDATGKARMNGFGSGSTTGAILTYA